MKHTIILFSIIGCTITHSSFSMLRFIRVIGQTSPKKNWYHTKPEDKYEKIGRSIINGRHDNRRKHEEMIKIQQTKSLPESSCKNSDSSSHNTHQDQTLQAFYTQQTIDIATSSSWYSGW